MKEDDFNFTQQELEILFWMKYKCVKAEINFGGSTGFISSIFDNEKEKVKKKSDITNIKMSWLNEWSAATKKLLNINGEINNPAFAFAKLNAPEGKRIAFAVELATFTPYFPLNNDCSRYKSLKFNVDGYLTDAKIMLPVFTAKDISSCRSNFDSAAKDISKKISGSNNTLMWLGIGAAICLIVAPYLAGAIGGLMGLSGAAATSAGLAFLGGGSLAAGGLGMSGGYVAVMAGGALLGYKGGNASFKKRMQETSQEEILISCAKLVATLGFIKQSMNCTYAIDNYCESARLLQFDYESNADQAFANRNGERGKKNAKKAATLVAFRRQVRTMTQGHLVQ